MKSVIVIAMVLGSFSALAQNFAGVDNQGNDCEVQIKPARRNTFFIMLKASGDVIEGEFKARTRVLKIKKSSPPERRDHSSTVTLERRARILLEDSRPLSFTIQSDVVVTSLIRVREVAPGQYYHLDMTGRYYPDRHHHFDRGYFPYNNYPSEMIFSEIKVESSKAVECQLN